MWTLVIKNKHLAFTLVFCVIFKFAQEPDNKMCVPCEFHANTLLAIYLRKLALCKMIFIEIYAFQKNENIVLMFCIFFGHCSVQFDYVMYIIAYIACTFM